MSPLRLGLLGARRRLRRSLAAVLTLAVCATVALAAATIVRGADRAAEAALASGTGLRQIDLEARDDDPEVKRLTPAALDAVRALPGVRAVEPVIQASFDSGADESLPPFLLYATAVRGSLPPPLVRQSRAAVFPLRGNEVVLPATGDGHDLTPLLGRTVTVAHTRRTGENRGTAVPARVRVVGLYDPSWQVDGPGAAYADAPLVAEWAADRDGVSAERFLAARGWDGATVVVDRPGSVAPVLRRLQAEGHYAYAVADRLRELPPLLELFRWGSLVMLALLAVTAVATGLGMGGALLRERVHEIGLLRAVGYRRRRVAGVFAVELGATGLLAGAAGALLGTAAGALAVGRLAGSEVLAGRLPEHGAVLPAPWTVLLTLLLPAAAVLLGAARPLLRAARLDPVRALRDR